MRKKLKHSPDNHFFSEKDVQLFDLDNIYFISSIWYESGMLDVWATFDLFVRDMPPHRNFLFFGGLEEMILNLQKWRYTDEQIDFLLKEKTISAKFGKYLKNFRFRGDVWAMPEGTIFFPGEPLVRITAPIIHANLLTMFLMNCVNVNILYMSKFVRVVIAAAPQAAIGPAPQRGHGFEAGMKNQRCAYLVGTETMWLPAARKKFGVDITSKVTNANHAFISSFPTEIEAFRKVRDLSQVDYSVMVDTYDFHKGLKNLIAVLKEAPLKSKNLPSVIIDSGDLGNLCKIARKELDKAGLREVKIVLASNLDECKILKLKKEGVPADGFIVDTAAVTCSDAPVLETVYKLSELIKDSHIEYKMKLSKNKISLPGRKQVYRLFEKGQYKNDVIGLEGERIGKSLLRPIFKKGKLVYHLPSLLQIKSYIAKEIRKLPSNLLRIDKEFSYRVEYSQKLKDLMKRVKTKILKQYCDKG